MVKRAGRLGLVAAMALLAMGQTHAAERVTLRNGFDQVCDHRESDGEKVRCYLAPGSFFEVNAADIASVEQVPDAPKAVRSAAASTTTPQSPKLTPAELHELMSKAGAQHNLDTDLLASVVYAESGGNARAVSRAGAKGLMQLMPGTATELGVHDSFAADQNINGGTAYLDALLITFHDNIALALAAYNAGPAAVEKYHGIPPYRETQAYVARVIREFNRLKSSESRRTPLHAAAQLATAQRNSPAIASTSTSPIALQPEGSAAADSSSAQNTNP